MARENKAKRDERRFGKAERLADMFDEPWTFPCYLPKSARDQSHANGVLELRDLLRESIRQVPIVLADNVCEMFYATDPKADWDYQNDFPSCFPPFAKMFVEVGRPSCVLVGKDAKTAGTNFPDRWGWYIESKESGGTFEIAATMVMCTSGRLSIPGGCQFGINTDGCIAAPLAISVGGGDALDASGRDTIAGDLMKFLYPILLSLTFMNFKNVTMQSRNPNAKLNRERQKHDLKPFLRYRTIIIDQSSGGSHGDGGSDPARFDQPLRVHRGHMKQYTPEKPRFNRPKDGVGLFWCPAHVRGSAKNGIVISDYDVKAPKPPITGD